MMSLISACEDSSSNNGEPKAEVTDIIEEVFETEPTASGQVQVGLCYEEQFAPLEENIIRKVDIVIVPDTSGSIVEERSNIALGFSSFISSLPEEVDFRIGVVLAHGPNSSRSGKLYQKGSEDIVLDSEVLSTEDIINGLNTKMQNPAGDNASDGGEMGVYSLTKAITDNLEENRANGLFREDASLVVIFVADEQDICAEFPSDVIPVPDPQGKENSSFANHCVDGEGELLYHPEQIINELENLQGDKPLVVGGVIYNNALTVPANSENEVGYGYLETIEMAQGLSVDLASGDYSTGLANLGKLAQVSIQPVKDFPLKTDKVDPDSIELHINNQPIDHTLDSELNIVSMDIDPDPFDIINLNYCEKAELPKQVAKIISGGNHSCAIIYDGTMKCWGNNSFGQLGLGHTDNIGNDEKPSSTAALSFGQPIVDASAGLTHTCVLLTDGSVKCFGSNDRGQLGQGHTDNLGDNESLDSIPAVNLGRNAIKIYSGTKYNCALLDNHQVKCWGENNFGQLGYGHTNSLGDDEDLDSYGNVPLGDTAVSLDISTISYHTCAVLTSNSSLKCWGLNNQGQLGYGHTNNLGDDEQPSSYGGVSFGQNILQVATGFSHTCALSDGQQVRCWGSNSVGQSGLGSMTSIGDDEAPDSVGFLNFGLSGIKMVATGNNHSCVIGLNESLHCFGLGSNGQTGHGNTDNIGDNEAVLGNSLVSIDLALTQVAAGLNHTCTLTKDEGRVICFGLGSSGQLGYGNNAKIGDDEIPWEFVEVLSPEQLPSL